MGRIKDITYYSLRQLRSPVKKHTKKSNRSKLDLINGILEASQYPSSIIDLSYHTYTSFSEAKKLVSYLLSCGLLETFLIDEDSYRYKTTEKGFIYLEKYKEMKKMLEWKVDCEYHFPKQCHCALCNIRFVKKGQLKLHKQEHAY